MFPWRIFVAGDGNVGAETQAKTYLDYRARVCDRCT